MPNEANEAQRRRQILQAGGVPTRETVPSKAMNFSCQRLTKEGPQRAAFMVHPDFLAELMLVNKTAADVDLVTRDTPKQKAELINAFARLQSGQSIDILGAHLSADALDRALLGGGQLNRFKIVDIDPQTKKEIVYYFLPCLDPKTARITLLRLDLETKGQLQDLSLKRTGEKLVQTESRLNLPSGIRVKEEERIIPGIGHPVRVESAVGTFSFAGRVVSFEGASTGGGRKGIDEDYSMVRQFNIPGIGEVMVAEVNDGMGGAAVGEKASEVAAMAEINFFIELSANPRSSYHDQIERLAQTKHNGDKRAALIELASNVKAQAVYDERIKSGLDMGTTTTEFFIFNDAIYSANVGDSRGYMNAGGGYYRETDDHSLVESLVSAGQLPREEAQLHPQKNMIYRTLGDKPTVQVDIKNLGFPKGEFTLVLACDGFTFKDVSGGRVEAGRRVNPKEWFSDSLRDSLQAFPNRPAEVIAVVVAEGVAIGSVDNSTFLKLSFSAPKQ